MNQDSKIIHQQILEWYSQKIRSRYNRLHQAAHSAAQDLAARAERGAADRKQFNHPKTLAKSLGPLGAATIDAGRLAGIYKKAEDRVVLSGSRLENLQKTSRRIESLLKKDEERNAGDCVHVLPAHFDREHLDKIIKDFFRHLRYKIELVGLVRKAKLELRGHYVAEVHDAFFKNFAVDDFFDEEFELIARPVLFIPYAGHSDDVAVLLDFLSSSHLPMTAGRAVSLEKNRLPRPAADGVFSGFIYTQGPAADLENLLTIGRGRQTHFFDLLVNAPPVLFESGVWPTFTFDPDSTNQTINQKNLPGPIDPEVLLTDPVIRDLKEVHEALFELEEKIEHAYALPLADFLKAGAGERQDHLPYIQLDEKKYIVGPSLLAYFDGLTRRHRLWQKIFSKSGANRESVSQTKAQLSPISEQAAAASTLPVFPKPEPTPPDPVSLSGRQTGFDRAQVERETVRRLVEKLSGLSPAQITTAVTGTDTNGASMHTQVGGEDVGRANDTPTHTGAKPANTETKPGAPAKNALPWVETDLCTACGECTAINGTIFGLNAKKQAFIKDPYGGPFRDIVKAAEKCAAGVIHPGDPLKPSEKDLQKWIKRAARFQ